MTEFAAAFRAATGQDLYPGTLNVKIAAPLQIREHFRIPDPIDPNQNLLFEICRINGFWAYRIRPSNIQTGDGGHGDDTIEIACSQEVPNVRHGSVVEIEFFR